MNPWIHNTAMKMGAGSLPSAAPGLAWLGGLPRVPAAAPQLMVFAVLQDANEMAKALARRKDMSPRVATRHAWRRAPPRLHPGLRLLSPLRGYSGWGFFGLHGIPPYARRGIFGRVHFAPDAVGDAVELISVDARRRPDLFTAPYSISRPVPAVAFQRRPGRPPFRQSTRTAEHWRGSQG